MNKSTDEVRSVIEDALRPFEVRILLFGKRVSSTTITDVQAKRLTDGILRTLDEAGYEVVLKAPGEVPYDTLGAFFEARITDAQRDLFADELVPSEVEDLVYTLNRGGYRIVAMEVKDDAST